MEKMNITHMLDGFIKQNKHRNTRLYKSKGQSS